MDSLELSPAKIILMSLDSRIIPNKKTGVEEVNYWFRVIMNHGIGEFGVEFAIEGNIRFEFYLN